MATGLGVALIIDCDQLCGVGPKAVVRTVTADPQIRHAKFTTEPHSRMVSSGEVDLFGLSRFY